MTENHDYVSRAAWVAGVGRPELIDEVADEFERHREPAVAELGRVAFWSRETPGWPMRAAS